MPFFPTEPDYNLLQSLRLLHARKEYSYAPPGDPCTVTLDSVHFDSADPKLTIAPLPLWPNHSRTEGGPALCGQAEGQSCLFTLTPWVAKLSILAASFRLPGCPRTWHPQLPQWKWIKTESTIRAVPVSSAQFHHVIMMAPLLSIKTPRCPFFLCIISTLISLSNKLLTQLLYFIFSMIFLLDFSSESYSLYNITYITTMYLHTANPQQLTLW